VAERLLHLCAGTAARRADCEPEIRELIDVADWELTARLLSARRLLTLLGPRLLELAGEACPESFASLVAEALDAGRRRSGFLEMIASRAIAALGDAGVRSTELKGPSLSLDLYGDPGRRLSNDIDLLVEPGELSRAVQALSGLGYAAPADHVGHDGLPLLHFAMRHDSGELPPVELHWRIHWYERRFAVERLLPPAGPAAPGWRPAAVDQLAALLLFYARDGFIDLRLATDIGALWDARSAELTGAQLTALRTGYPSLDAPLEVAVLVAERTVGLPAEQLVPRRALPPRSRLALNLARPYPHVSEPQVYADIGLIDGLLTPWSGIGGFVTRQLILPLEVRREHARQAARDRVSSNFGHATRVLARYVFAIGSALRVSRRHARF
jgi:hypothetical protein